MYVSVTTGKNSLLVYFFAESWGPKDPRAEKLWGAPGQGSAGKELPVFITPKKTQMYYLVMAIIAVIVWNDRAKRRLGAISRWKSCISMRLACRLARRDWTHVTKWTEVSSVILFSFQPHSSIGEDECLATTQMNNNSYFMSTNNHLRRQNKSADFYFTWRSTDVPYFSNATHRITDCNYY